MSYHPTEQVGFISEMAEHQLTAKEFFCSELLDSLDRNLSWRKAFILFFEQNGDFLCWVTREGRRMDAPDHPYRKFAENDVIKHKIFHAATRDGMTYFDFKYYMEQSTSVIDPLDYDHSAYVRFLEENFQAHYSVTLAFGINGYIQLVFLKTEEEGDFSTQELEQLKEIYVYIANFYKNFKKYERSRIVSDLKSKIMETGEKAYLVTDNFMCIVSYSESAKVCLQDILGPLVMEQFQCESPCTWLPFLLGSKEEEFDAECVYTRTIQDYVFNIHTFDQHYANGFLERYHWITIAKKECKKELATICQNLPLTQTEYKVAELMYNGLTYKQIADTLVVSYHTIKKHVQNIYVKCGVNSRYQLYKWLENKKGM